MTILSVILAIMFLMAGAMKLMTPQQKLAMKMGWANDVPAMTIKLIGLIEVVGAFALVLPLWMELPANTSFYAAGVLLVLMIGAVGVHLRRGEKKEMMMPLVLLILLGYLMSIL